MKQRNTKMNLRASAVSALAIMSAVGLPAAAAAQDEQVVPDQGAAAAASTDLETIIVTARRREESLMDVPESVVAFGKAQLEQQGIDDLASIGAMVPNLNLSQRTDGFPNATIRGIGGFGNTQGVGFYLDDVQLFSDASSRFGDLQRIEVLKGPQGTLYGGSNIGGAVKYVSARPEASGVFGHVKGTVGSWNLTDVEGGVNLPLGQSRWALRGFGFYADQNGFLTNGNPPRVNGARGTNDRNLGAMEEAGARLMLAGPITDRLSLYASARWNRYEGVGNAWIREVSDDFTYSREVNNSRNSDHLRDTRAGMVELTFDLDKVKAVSITSFTDSQSDTYSDVDMREEFIFDSDREHGTKVFTQELRFLSNNNGPFSWISGLYYSRVKEKVRSRQIWFDARMDEEGNFSGALGCAAGMPTCSGVWVGDIPTTAQEADTAIFPLEQRNRLRTNMAGFASASYKGGPWTVDAGVRVDRWSNETLNVLSGIDGSKDAVEILPRLSVSRKFGPGTMAYATYAPGYEPGGYNLSSFVGEGSLFGYDKEQTHSFEVGLKSKFLDNRASLTLAAFHIAYKDRQSEYQSERDGQIIEGIINVGDSKSWGTEAELEVQATEHLNLRAVIGWLQSEWSKGTLVDLGTSIADLSGVNVPAAGPLSWVLSTRYERPLEFIKKGKILFGAQLGRNGQFLGLPAWDPVRNPAYTTLNLQAGILTPNWELMVQAENVTGTDYFTDLQRFPNLHVLDGGDTVVIGTLGQPRTIKASLTFRF